MIRLFRREWAPVTFVATVLIGAVVSGSRSWSAPVATPTPCPLRLPAPPTRPGRPRGGSGLHVDPFAFGNCPAPPTEPPASASPTPTRADRDAEPVRLGLRVRLGLGFRVRLGLGFRVGVSLGFGEGFRLSDATLASG